jgi:hypothetical protein
MIKSAIALSLALSTFFTAMPAIGVEEFKCSFRSKSNDPAKLEQIKRLLPNVTAMTDVEKLSATIASFRRDGMQRSLIIDHLVGAYCPMIAREVPLTAAEKTALVQRFTGQVTMLVYSLESDQDIIINVPLTPYIVDAVNTAAKTQGLSTTAWIAMTIDNALSQQITRQRQ